MILIDALDSLVVVGCACPFSSCKSKKVCSPKEFPGGEVGRSFIILLNRKQLDTWEFMVHLRGFVRTSHRLLFLYHSPSPQEPKGCSKDVQCYGEPEAPWIDLLTWHLLFQIANCNWEGNQKHVSETLLENQYCKNRMMAIVMMNMNIWWVFSSLTGVFNWCSMMQWHPLQRLLALGIATDRYWLYDASSFTRSALHGGSV